MKLLPVLNQRQCLVPAAGRAGSACERHGAQPIAPVTSTDFRSDLPSAGDELQTLHGALERIRGTFVWKCGGLDADAMRQRSVRRG